MSQQNDALIGHLLGQITALTQIVGIAIHLSSSKQYIIASLRESLTSSQVETHEFFEKVSSTHRAQYAEGYSSVYKNLVDSLQ